jgi:hypothetical protein
MSRGILIFAHNSRELDYALLAIVSASLAKKFLKVPVSLITDKSTIKWMESSKIYNRAVEIFDKIIEIDRPLIDNRRNLNDGDSFQNIPFINSTRSQAWELTPYDQTLLIDSDFLIFSDNLNNFWSLSDFMMAESCIDVNVENRLGYHDRYISDVGIKMLWATTVMFKKNRRSKVFFDLAESIRKNYDHYADIFRFNPRQFRNDITFSIAKHIIDGFSTEKFFNLPPVLTTLSKDILHSIKDDRLIFLISKNHDNEYALASIKNLDVHVMNKQSIVRNAEILMRI